MSRINNKHIPLARSKDLSITIVGEEMVVYDQLTHQASCLNAVTGAVWQNCNGDNDPDIILTNLHLAGFQDAKIETINLALIELDKAQLLQIAHGSVKPVIDRREALRTLGKGVAIPVISSISIQSAIAGISCANFGESCISISCCSGLTCNGSSGNCE